MPELRWSAPLTITDILTTELTSLANGNNALSNAIDNTVNRKTFIDLELFLASIDMSAQTALVIYIWFLTSLDGTNYEDGAAAVTPSRQPDVVIPIRAVNEAQRIALKNIIIPPFQFKILLQNATGTTFAGSGNTLKYRLHSTESN